MITFPTSPTTGQIFTTAGLTWTWDGLKWKPSTTQVWPASTAPSRQFVTGVANTGAMAYSALPAATVSALGAIQPDVTATVSSGGLMADSVGYRNRIINGDMNVSQRFGTTSTPISSGISLAYLVDRFYGYCTGANISFQQVANAGASGSPSLNVIQFTGAASVTGIGIGQRIEAANSYDLAGKTTTLSVNLANSLLTTIAWTAYYATTADTFGTLASPTKTQFATGTFTVNSTLTTYSTHISVPSAAITGIEIVFTVGAQISGTWTIGNVQWELGSVATPFERLPPAVSLALCQRYYQTYEYHCGIFNMLLGQQSALPVQMRAGPTFTYKDKLGRASTVSIWNGTTQVNGTNVNGGGFGCDGKFIDMDAIYTNSAATWLRCTVMLDSEL